MRSRVLLLTFFLMGFFLVQPLSVHAMIPFLGPIIPNATNTCAAGWGMIIIVINNIIEFLITIAIVFVAPIMIAYSGFLMVWNQGNSGQVTKAKGILTNVVVGIVVALAAWMIVDAVMAVFYNSVTPVANGNGSNAGVLKTWSNIINWGNGDNLCLIQAGSLETLNQAQVTGISANGTVTASTAFSTSSGNPCNPATIMAATSATQTQANLLACVAQGESTCGTLRAPANLNYSWNKDAGKGSASTAAGAYQVLLSTNSDCYNNAVCEQAGGTPGVPLNCKAGFGANGFTAGGNKTILDRCVLAAGNVQCSAAAAVCLLKTQSFSSAYATDPYTTSCKSKYGGG